MKPVGAPYHTAQDPANRLPKGNPNGEPYTYPWDWHSLFTWSMDESDLAVQDWQSNKRGYLAVLISELVGAFILYFIVTSATSVARQYANALIYTAWIPLVAGAAYAMVHFLFTKFSLKLTPQHSVFTLLMPHSWVNRNHYAGKSEEKETRKSNAVIECLLELVGQGTGTVLGVMLAASLEDGTMLGHTDRAGAPVFQFMAPPTHWNYVLFFTIMLAQMVISIGYAVSTFEVPRHSTTNPLFSFYAGASMFLGYWIAQEKTGSVFSLWQMLGSCVVLHTTDLVPIYNEWGLLLGGHTAGAFLGLSIWLVILRTTRISDKFVLMSKQD